MMVTENISYTEAKDKYENSYATVAKNKRDSPYYTAVINKKRRIENNNNRSGYSEEHKKIIEIPRSSASVEFEQYTSIPNYRCQAEETQNINQEMKDFMLHMINNILQKYFQVSPDQKLLESLKIDVNQSLISQFS
uniref:Uncharacterized protein LOC114336457 n=1 Tax=Diabrotica virgifera virgifera TaxID=50390 RepID=A0A6P7GCP1_DIAVI